MIKFFQKLKAKKGFTLVELIVVIAIIGVLAAILIPTMLGYVTSSKVQSANSTATEVKNSINNFITDMDTKGYAIEKNAGKDAKTAQATWEITFTNGAADSWTKCDKTIFSKAGEDLKGPSTATNKSIFGYLEEKLEADYTFNNVAITAYINEGKCVGVVYYADGNAMVGDNECPTFEQMTGKAATPYAWSGTDGVTAKNGAVLGTSPQLVTKLS